ncbi:MAG TPA: hypothetical protein VM557_11315 [Thermoanaerobaculia bacterium]|nr:hypothetical protein [Thermoanaerobaculia bacterium]
MRFQVEQIFLTTQEGSPLPANSGHSPALSFVEAPDPLGAARIFISNDHASELGPILSVRGFGAIATVKRDACVYTITVLPDRPSGGSE